MFVVIEVRRGWRSAMKWALSFVLACGRSMGNLDLRDRYEMTHSYSKSLGDALDILGGLHGWLIGRFILNSPRMERNGVQ